MIALAGESRGSGVSAAASNVAHPLRGAARGTTTATAAAAIARGLGGSSAGRGTASGRAALALGLRAQARGRATAQGFLPSGPILLPSIVMSLEGTRNTADLVESRSETTLGHSRTEAEVIP
jgi:hypothetical protein